MKTQVKQLGFFACLFVFFLSFISVHAQDNGDYFTISGVVKDKSSKKKLEYVNISVPGSDVSGITNEDGEFSFKIRTSVKASEIEFSRIGYYSSRVAVDGKNQSNLTFYLTPNETKLKEITVEGWSDPRDLVREAIKRVGTNYSSKPNLLTGFYRETVQKGRKYINVSEAIVNIYKSSYTETGVIADKVQIYKGRKLLSTKKSDTLAVKLLGGPTLSVYADIVKNQDILFDDETLNYFNFKMDNSIFIDDRQQYVVSFEPVVSLPYPLVYGKVYIDKESLAFTRAEFFMDMKDRNKATDAILKKKPAGLRFKPEEVSFVVTYKQRNGKSYLNYIRNEVKFKCDWKRRLFATNYSVMSEVVITESQEEQVAKIPRKEVFHQHQSLDDKVMDFFDSQFWGAYNIIEPTESLESAVSKLKKQQN